MLVFHIYILLFTDKKKKKIHLCYFSKACPTRCYVCGCAEETVRHVLLHCTIVRFLWDVFFVLVGIRGANDASRVRVQLSSSLSR